MVEAIAVTFKNLEPSQFVRDAVNDRILPHLEKFPDLRDAKIRVTIEMKKSPIQAGPDNFAIKLQVLSGKYRGLVISKKRETFYLALADVTDHLLKPQPRESSKGLPFWP